MQQSIVTIGMLVGGLGLFLLAVKMITDGLKEAAGYALRDMLGQWTRSPAHGIVSGFSITALVQSSSAVTVATIGFVNAGLLTMHQALGVVYGANIGTTITGWLVAIVGFKIKVEAFALPLIGIGMLLNLTGGGSRRAPLGMALAGFGLFFIGIDFLRDAFEGLAATIDLNRFTAAGVSGVLLYVGIGLLMTVLTQSSSAAIAITLTAATGGILGLHAAAAMVVGANVGTTSTAVIAAIGATPNARRVAAAHVIFNLGTGLVALIILPVLFWMVNITGKVLGLEDIPAVTLALFHTSFNILGVLLMWPLTSRLSHFLENRFVTLEEVEGRPKYLDKTVIVTPMLALNALTLELTRIAAVTRRMMLATLSIESGPVKHIERDHMIVEQLSNAVADFITKLGRGSLSAEVAEKLSKILRAEQHLLACAVQAREVARAQSKLKLVSDAELSEGLARYRSDVVRLIEISNPGSEGFSFAASESQLDNVQVTYNDIKAKLLRAGSEFRVPVADTIDILEQNSRIRRMVRQMFKAAHHISELYVDSEIKESEKADLVGEKAQ